MRMAAQFCRSEKDRARPRDGRLQLVHLAKVIERAGPMSGNVSDVAETDEDILTFGIPDDALERAAGDAAPLITLVPCTFHWHDCHWPQ